MLVGIMAIFEMAISFDTQQMSFRPPDDDYFGSNAQAADRDLMVLLDTPNLLQSIGESVGTKLVPLRGSSLCDQLMCRINLGAQDLCADSNQFDSLLFGNSSAASYQPGEPTRSSSSELVGSCALSFPPPQSDHRVLVAPNQSNDPLELARQPYLMYSCSINQESICSFEQD